MKRILLLCVISMLLFSSVTTAQKLSDKTVGVSIDFPDDFTTNSVGGQVPLNAKNIPFNISKAWMVTGIDRYSDILILISGTTEDFPYGNTINNYTDEKLLSLFEHIDINKLSKSLNTVGVERQIINGYPTFIINQSAIVYGQPYTSVIYSIIKNGKLVFIIAMTQSQYFHHFLPIVWQSINTLHIE